jgi:hypothetical protein
LEYDADFKAALAAGGPGPAGTERFKQERALFGFFTSAVSSIDCFFMAAYVIGCAIPSPSFVLDKPAQLKRPPRNIALLYIRDFAADAFAEQLTDVASSKLFELLKDTRDVLSHRGALLRTHFIQLGGGERFAAVPSNPKALAEEFVYSYRVDPRMTRVWTEWTTTTVNKLMQGLHEFLDRRGIL